MGKIDNKRPTVISSCRLLSANYYCSSKSPRLALATIFVFAATALMNANFYTCAPAAELLSEDDSSSLTLQNDIDRVCFSSLKTLFRFRFLMIILYIAFSTNLITLVFVDCSGSRGYVFCSKIFTLSKNFLS